MKTTKDLSRMYKGVWIADERKYKATFCTHINGCRRNHQTLKAAIAFVDQAK